MSAKKDDPSLSAAPKSEVPPLRPLAGLEVLGVVASVVAAYGGAMFAAHRWQMASSSSAGASGREEVHAHQGNYWGTLPSAWDHPEPNYVVSEAIGEFWSVATTIPVAGSLLLYQGLRYKYSAQVLVIYLLTCGMYTLAFTAHFTLQNVIFSSTVIAVMSNALLTFAQFSWVAHQMLRSKLVRGAVVLLAEVVLVGTVVTLPYAIENGGVWTLFFVQSPGVFLATAIASGLAWYAKTKGERDTFRLVCISGSLLSTAMVCSLVECLIGFEHGFLSNFWGFPWLHIIIHTLEQVGIYLFGVGVASLDALLLPPLRSGSEVRTVGRWPLQLVYLYCPRTPGVAGTDEETKQSSQGASGDKLGASAVAPSRGRPPQAGSIVKRKRTDSPGLVALTRQPVSGAAPPAPAA